MFVLSYFAKRIYLGFYYTSLDSNITYMYLKLDVEITEENITHDDLRGFFLEQGTRLIEYY